MIFGKLRLFYEFYKAFEKGINREILGDYNLSSKELLYAVAINSDYAFIYDAIIRNTVKNGKYDTALDFAINAEKKFSDNPLFPAYKGLIYMLKKEYENALTEYNKAVAKDGTNSEYYFKRAYLHFFTENIQAAINDCNAILNLNKNNSEIYSLRGFFKFLKGLYTESVKDYTEALNLTPDKEHYRFMRALAYKNAGNTEAYNKDIQMCNNLSENIEPIF